MAVNESVPDEHKTLGVAFIVDAGEAFTVTLVVVIVFVPQPLVADNVYIPAFVTDAVNDGLRTVDE